MPRNTPPSLISYTEIAFTGSTTPRSSASVSWNAGDIIVTVQGNENGTTVPATPTATGLTFTNRAITPSSGAICGASVCTASPGSSGSSAVTITGTSGQDSGVGIWVWRGSDGVGVNFEQHTAALVISKTPTDTHSAFCFGVFDFAAVATGGSLLTPTVTNTRAGGSGGGGVVIGTNYTVWLGDEDNQASSSATSYGITTGSTGGPFSIIGVEILGTTTSTLVYPPPRTATRNRSIFAVRRRPSIPVPIQDSPVQWRQPEAPPLSHARLVALLRGRRTFVVPPQIPVPPTIPGNRISSGRSKIAATRRGRQTNPVLAQATVITPTWVPQRIAPKRLLGSTARGKRTLLIADTAVPPQTKPSRVRLATAQRGKQWSAATMQQPVVITIWPPPKLGAPRRLFGSTTRGRRSFPTPAQIPVPLPVWPTRTPANRRSLAALRRGHRNDPPWTITAPITPTYVPQPTRTRARLAAIQRGKRFDPHFWFMPEICYPTSASIAPYGSAAAFAPYGSTVAFRAYSSTSAFRAYSSSTAIRAYSSTGAITGYSSAPTFVKYTSAVTHFNTCDD